MSTISVQDVAKEVNEYIKHNPDVVTAGVYSPEITINKYAKTITAVKGKYPAFHSILTNVVQGFKAEWQELGEAQFKHKMLKNFHQKVNYPVVPSEILNSYLAELYTEGKKADEHPISKYIMDELMQKVVDNLEDLSLTAAFDADAFDGQYGYSLDGIATQVQNALASTEYPCFRIPTSSPTATNILDVVKAFERGIPSKTRKKVKYIFMSENMAMNFADKYEQVYGTKVTYTDSDTMKTPLTKKEIVGLPGIPDTMIFGFVDQTFLRLIDVFDKPAVTDVQIHDYKLKIFMDFHLGYDFMINQLLYVAVFDGGDRGLRNAAQNALYYESENLQTSSE